MSITWSKYFDKIYCLHFVPYTQRKQLMQFQLNRVGILNSGIFEWQLTFNNYLDQKFKKFLNNLITSQTEKKLTNYSINLGHYNCIRDAYYKGYQRILILEDDVRFLKDLNLIEQILQNRPEDADLILYDKMISFDVQTQQFKPFNQYYSTFTNCWSASCYSLSRKGMQRLIFLLENKKINIDAFFMHAQEDLKELKYYSSNINLAIQCIFENSFTKKQVWEEFGPNSRWYIFFNLLKINFDDYYMRKDGSPYYYGDWIEEPKKSNQIILTSNKSQIIDMSEPIIPTQINIFLAVTNNHVDKLFKILNSLLKYSQSKFNIYIMIDDQNIQPYYQQFASYQTNRITIKLLNNKLLKQNLHSCYKHFYFTDMTFAKLLIPTLFPNLDRILYLDYDTIITNKGIEWLYNIDFEDNYLAACEDLITMNNLLFLFPYYPESMKDYKHLHNKLTYYFNAGIMLLNLKKIREDGKDKELLNVIQHESNNIPWSMGDQTMLNYIFRNKCLDLNWVFNSGILFYSICWKTQIWEHTVKEKWNFNSREEYRNNIIINHFAGFNKPWNKNPQIHDFLKPLYEQYNKIK